MRQARSMRKNQARRNKTPLKKSLISRVSHDLPEGQIIVGSAPALGAGCREFESPISDQVGVSDIKLTPIFSKRL